MQATLASPTFSLARTLSSPAPAVARRSQEEPIDKAELTGSVLGGLTCGAGLGYLGMELGMRWGMEYGMGLLGSHPLAQVLALLTLGIQYGVLGAVAVGAVGATAGVAVGMYLGGKAGKALGHHQA